MQMPEPAESAHTRTSLSLERYRTRLGFWQVIWGTLISGGVAVAIPAAVDAYKARLDLQLKQRDIESRALDFHQTYISKFLDTALNQDVELRLRFSEYFSFVSEKESRDQWRKYHEELEKRRDAVRKSINEKELRAAQLSAISNPSSEQQIEQLQLRRELEWTYAEVGYARQDSNVTIPNLSNSVLSSAPIDSKTLSPENELLFSKAIIEPSRVSELERAVELIKTNKARYQSVEAATRVPWFAVALVHFAQTAGDFTTNLHNGETLNRVTVTVPKGRGPFKNWEESATDALTIAGWTDASPDGFLNVGRLLFKIEGFDGFGYHRFGVRSPFLWGCTNLYTGGKYVADGVFDPNAKAKQCGAAALLKLLMRDQIAPVALASAAGPR
jgi:lysozyme family protein